MANETATTLPKFRKALVPTDFSPAGNAAIPYAYSLVGAQGTVCLMHVVEPWHPPNPLIPQYEAHSGKGEHAQKMTELKAKLRDLIPIAPETKAIQSIVQLVENQDASKAICSMAEDFGADVICIGAHTHSFVTSILGTLSKSIVSHSRVPVLVVSENLRQ